MNRGDTLLTINYISSAGRARRGSTSLTMTGAKAGASNLHLSLDNPITPCRVCSRFLDRRIYQRPDGQTHYNDRIRQKAIIHLFFYNRPHKIAYFYAA
jgi:hypothetical protein